MKFQLDDTGGRNRITSYGKGYVAVNGERLERNLIVTPETVVRDWVAGSFDDLTEEHLQSLQSFGPEVVLLGSGRHQQFPGAELQAVLTRLRVGVEIMNTPAACRTYNILTAESRRVVAALFSIEG